MARGFVDPDDPYDTIKFEDIAGSKKLRGRLAGAPGSAFNIGLSRYEELGPPRDEELTEDLRFVNRVANYFEAISINDPDDNEGVDQGPYPPAPLLVVPTSTMDPARPRTIAAGYNHKTKIMTVVFRDGTWWNYFKVPQTVWNNFKAAYSKGRFLYAHGFDDRYGGASIRYSGQPATSTFISQTEQTVLATRARAVQVYTEGLQLGQTAAQRKKALKRGYSQNRPGGTASRRTKRTS